MARAPGRPEPLVQRLVDQRVHEAETADPLGRLVQQRRRDRSLQPIQQLALRRVRRAARGARARTSGRSRPRASTPRGPRPRAARRGGSITSRTLSGRPSGAERSTLQRPVASSKSSRPDSTRLRSISPTKNGLPSVSLAISPASASASSSSSWPAASAITSDTSSAPRPSARCARHPRSAAGPPAPRRADDPCPDPSRGRRRSPGAPVLGGRHHVLEQRHRLAVRPVQIVEHEAHRHRRRQLHERPATAEKSR